MRIFITGGSGFIGTTAVRHFLDLGWTVCNVDLVAPKIEDQRAYWVACDIRDAQRLRAALSDFRPDFVLNLAAQTGADQPDLKLEDLDTNMDGVEALIDAIRAAGTVKRTIFVSSLLVCRNGYIPQSDEDYCPPGAYGASKVEGEKIVRGRSGFGEWVIVRPTSVWGPWFEHSYKTFFKMVQRNLYVHIRGGKDLIKPITFVGNTAYMFEKILTSGSNLVASQTFYLGDYPATTVGGWADTVQRALKSRPILTLPLWPLRMAAAAGDVLKRLGYKDPPLSSFRLQNLMTGGDYPLEKTQLVVGPLPFSLGDGVAQTVRWMRERGELR
ncbi:MAG TPA: NAD(P)-dependent oxidoreductase [Rhizomicrobium sp.]